MIEDYEKKSTEEYFGKPYDEIIEKAKSNLQKAGLDLNSYWVKQILDDDDGVSRAYLNDIPENLIDSPGWLYYYLTTD